MKECDLIMKGGITSGVVYPGAIRKIAGQYRLRSIGGSSAGAIGAATAAAAEYRRQQGGGMTGFGEIEAAARDLGRNLGALFQPTENVAPLYDLLIAAVSNRPPNKRPLPLALWPAVRRAFPGPLALGLFGALFGIGIGVALGNVWTALFIVLVSVLIAASVIGVRLYRMVFVALPANDFGICSGKTQPGHSVLAFSDWIGATIQRVAGRGPDDPPLTVGDLKAAGVEVATMTTDLSSGRPYQLPLRSDLHWFSKAEFEVLFPKPFVAWLCGRGERRAPRPGDPADLPRDLWKLPVGDDFPVLLVARLSLSFPGLIRAVPLYRVDYTRGSGDDAPMERCVFSDGGISSNFPIHLFDAFLPSRPTFGIALGPWETGQERTDLPEGGRQSTHLPVRPVRGLGGFAFAILNTAKDWQDSLQSLLHGYAERIVTVRLDAEKEGGLNLDMDGDTIRQLIGYGEDAGAKLTGFGFDQHRYDRALSVLGEMERAADTVAARIDAPPAGDPDGQTYRWVMTEFPTTRFANDPAWRRDQLAGFGDGVAGLSKPAGQRLEDGTLPKNDSNVRLVASADRLPKDANG